MIHITNIKGMSITGPPTHKTIWQVYTSCVGYLRQQYAGFVHADRLCPVLTSAENEDCHGNKHDSLHDIAPSWSSTMRLHGGCSDAWIVAEDHCRIPILEPPCWDMFRRAGPVPVADTFLS
jgi:hypothetical protein